MLGISPTYSQDFFSDMDYSQFLEFCRQDHSNTWNSMTVSERLVSNLCGLQGDGFGEKHWGWLNGASMDWKNFAQMASNEHVVTIPEFKDGIRETLRVDSFVSGRDSFPPPMNAEISFDYERFSQTKHYDEKFTICMDGKLVPQAGLVTCSDEYVKYDYTKESQIVPKTAKKFPMSEHTRQQMLEWCQNSPKYTETDKQFWDIIPVRLVSGTDEFQLLHGIKESFIVNSNAIEQPCPPNVWLSGTFTSKDGKRYGFALEYDSDHFRYYIDKTGMKKTIPTPRQQMKMGVPLEEIKCKQGFYPTFKIDRITSACVTDKTLGILMMRGWAPLRMGMPAETNILITYGAIQVYPHNVTKKLDPRSPYFNDVFWVNNDIASHTIVAKDGTWSTGIIESGKIGSMSFNKTGIYEYFIKERPSTTGFVEFSGIVEPDD